MHRKIIRIDEEKCDGCGLCVPSCAEGAIQIIEGKARLVSETYCDGLGACLGECPRGAISMEEREAPAFDEAAANTHLARIERHGQDEPVHAHFGACPGSAVRTLGADCADAASAEKDTPPSGLGHWPVQIRLIPPTAQFLKEADILVSSDCAPFAICDIHSRYLKGRAVLVGCPKLDDLDYYRDKLTEILAEANPRSVTVLRMEVPCCGGISQAVIEARDQVLPDLPVAVHTVGVRGEIQHEHSPGRPAIAQGDAL